jgi:hypothetical protein
MERREHGDRGEAGREHDEQHPERTPVHTEDLASDPGTIRPRNPGE